MPGVLTGRWRKASAAECAARYPDELEFFEATYLGKKGPGQRFIIWDAGGYEVVDNHLARIQIATDEQVLYRFTLVGDTVTFADAEGCEFHYRRAQ